MFDSGSVKRVGDGLEALDFRRGAGFDGDWKLAGDLRRRVGDLADFFVAAIDAVAIHPRDEALQVFAVNFDMVVLSARDEINQAARGGEHRAGF